MAEISDEVRAVERALGWSFRDKRVLMEALTHRSYVNERPTIGARDNERLELLGDAVLDLAVAKILFDKFPDAREGELTRRRADLVSESSLAALARTAGIPHALRMGKGEERTGGRDKPRMLACALEACFGALFLDAGLDAAVVACTALMGLRLDDEEPGAGDYKTRLQEYIQARAEAAPTYEVLGVSGPEHARAYRVGVVISGTQVCVGEGRSKSDAERAAARGALLEFGARDRAMAASQTPAQGSPESEAQEEEAT